MAFMDTLKVSQICDVQIVTSTFLQPARAPSQKTIVLKLYNYLFEFITRSCKVLLLHQR